MGTHAVDTMPWCPRLWALPKTRKLLLFWLSSGLRKSLRREVVRSRSSTGADAIHPPFGGSFVKHTLRHDIGFLAPCKIIILQGKMIPQYFFYFEPSTPSPPTGYHFLGGWGGGSQVCAEEDSKPGLQSS